MKLPGPVHPDRPEIGGFCFCEADGFSAEQANRMAATGKLFATEFRAMTHDGREAKFAGSLLAESVEGAREEALRRGLGEVVLGQLAQVLPQS